MASLKLPTKRIYTHSAAMTTARKGLTLRPKGADADQKRAGVSKEKGELRASKPRPYTWLGGTKLKLQWHL